jgi:hypothetical protein
VLDTILTKLSIDYLLISNSPKDPSTSQYAIMGQTQSRLGSNASSSNNGEVTEKILATADIDV